jgi:D-3-phosphoglycerate dehydrogenase
MTRFKVLCAWDDALGRDIVGERLPRVADVVWHNPPDRAWMLDHIGEFDVYLATLHVRFDKEMIDRAKRLKIVSTPTTGLDHLDLDALEQRGITLLSNTTEFGMLDKVTATAEMAWGLLLASCRHVPQAHAAAMRGEWARDKFRGHQLAYKTLGILGVGRLGKMVADYGNAFRMRVLGCDKQKITKAGVEQVDFETLLRESDVISIHVHLTPDNKHLIAKCEFDKMKRGVVIVNTSRGGIIKEDDFLAALESGQVGGAGLDVIEGEWRTDLVNHPLIRYAREHDNVAIVPHLGGITWESQRTAFIFTADKLAGVLEKMVQA